MSAISLVSLLQSLSNQNTAQGQSAAVTQGAAPAAPAQTPQATAQDEFTPSAQNAKSQATAQAAGLFTVPGPSPLALATARIQSTTPTTNAATPPNAVTVAATTPPAAQAPAPTPAVPVAPAAVATSAVSPQQQLQSLNLALAALGLSTQDIDQLDHVASTINDYNPSAFTAQAYRLEALAQASAQAAAATRSNVQAAPNNANATAPKTAAGAGKTSNT
jgi:hypothetical protein